MCEEGEEESVSFAVAREMWMRPSNPFVDTFRCARDKEVGSISVANISHVGFCLQKRRGYIALAPVPLLKLSAESRYHENGSTHTSNPDTPLDGFVSFFVASTISSIHNT